jgi:acetyltransferase-like isoleucine patch superfamily enzyme
MVLKKLKQAIIILYTFVRFSLLKYVFRRSLTFRPISLVYPSAEVIVDGESAIELGNKVYLKPGVKISATHGGKLSVGDNTFLNYNSMIVCHKNITIGKNVEFGPNVLVYDQDHDFRAGLHKQEYRCTEVAIGDNVWIGANSVILRGSNIGDNCVVGAGSVIKGEYPANSIIVQKREEKIMEYGERL